MMQPETFCGLLYRYWYPELTGQSSAHGTVVFNLALFSTLTGKEIYHERSCWSFCCTTVLSGGRSQTATSPEWLTTTNTFLFASGKEEDVMLVLRRIVAYRAT